MGTNLREYKIITGATSQLLRRWRSPRVSSLTGSLRMPYIRYNDKFTDIQRDLSHGSEERKSEIIGGFVYLSSFRVPSSAAYKRESKHIATVFFFGCPRLAFHSLPRPTVYYAYTLFLLSKPTVIVVTDAVFARGLKNLKPTTQHYIYVYIILYTILAMFEHKTRYVTYYYYIIICV